MRWTRPFAVIAVVVAAVTYAEVARADRSEHDYQATLCEGFRINEFIRQSGTYVDCVSDTHAIEVDFSGKWAEAIGQALHYADALDLAPGIILICKRVTSPEVCQKHSYLVEQTLVRWGISAQMWLCPFTSQTLSDCSPVAIEP